MTLSSRRNFFAQVKMHLNQIPTIMRIKKRLIICSSEKINQNCMVIKIRLKIRKQRIIANDISKISYLEGTAIKSGMQRYRVGINATNITSGDRQNWLRFVYTCFKSCDQPLDKTSLYLSNLFRARQSCDMNARSSIVLKLPKSMVI